MRGMRALTFAIIAVTLVAAFLVSYANAQGPPLPKPKCATEADVLGCLWADIVCTITLWFFGIVIVIGFLMLLAGGLKIITAAGEQRGMQEGRKFLTYAVVGIALALLARTIMFLIAGLLGLDISFFSC